MESELVGRLLRDGLYLEAVQCYVRNPPRSDEDHRLFLAVLQTGLDHVIRTSPSLLPSLLESLCPRFGLDEGVLLVLGKTFLRREMHAEAEYFLQKVLSEVNPVCLIARESLKMLYEMVVPRWHFHMLNDFVRNSSYSRAISEAVARIPDCSVLDIGSGTGFLSMLAVRSGASRVYACEMDATMATISHDIIAANGMADRISIINKMSDDLEIPQDIPERVCLVVTETVDAGLLGEAIARTIRGAWSQLLLPKQPSGSNEIARCGHVIPCGATVYLMAIECPYIARQSKLVSDEVGGGLSFRGIVLEGSCKGSSEETEVGEKWTVEMSNRGEGGRVGERVGRVWRGERGRENNGLSKEPYTCERLSSINGGYSELSRVHKALSLDFSDPEVPLSSVNLAVPVVREGCLDAVATYYDLHLDPTITISTSPHDNQNCSWEQAVYPVTTSADGCEGGGRISVAEGDTVHLTAICTDTLMHVMVTRIEKGNVGRPASGSSTGKVNTDCPVSGSSVGKGNTDCPVPGSSTGKQDVACAVSGLSLGHVDCPISGSSSVHFVDRGAMCRLNDAGYHEVYSEAISHALRLLRESEIEGESTADPNNPSTTGVKRHDCEVKSDDEMSTDKDGDIAEIIAMDLSHELSIFGLMAANIGVDFVQIGRCHDIYTSLVEAVARKNGLQEKTSIKWAELESTFEPSLLWDIVLCDVVSPQGILRPMVFEEIGSVRECQSHSDTVILPGRVAVHSVAISSPELRAQTTVLGSVPTLGLDIARFINKYQVIHYIDLDLSSLTHDRLTEDTELLSIDLNSLSNTPFKQEREVSVEVTRSGSLAGFLYWFSLHFPNGATISTAGSQHSGQLAGSHWHQAVFCLQEDVPLVKGQTLSLRVLVSDSLLDMSLSRVQ